MLLLQNDMPIICWYIQKFRSIFKRL